MRIFQALLFMLMFSLEVRVRANSPETSEESNGHRLLESPKACVAQKILPCQFLVSDGAFVNYDRYLRIHVSDQSILAHENPTTWTFMDGTMWIERLKGEQIQTLHDSLHSGVPSVTKEANNVQAIWLKTEGKSLLIRNVGLADVGFLLRDGREISIPYGFEVKIGEIGSNKKNFYSMPMPISLVRHIGDWQALYRGSSSDFRRDVRELVLRLKSVTERSSQIYLENALQRAAEVKEQENRLAQAQAHDRVERGKARKLLYERTFYR